MDWRIIGPISGALVGLFGWLAKHISNTKKHPCKDDIVFRDVCESERKRLDDCLENAVKTCAERYGELRRDMKEGFTELKQLIKNSRS